MPLKQSEAVVLRSYPLRESDLLVSFFTRSEGKLRGIARAAQKSRKRFGGALEPLTTVRVYWEDRERQDLARIDSCDVIASPLTDPVDYPRAVGLAHVAEVLDEVMPDREANDAIFRLTVSVLAVLKRGVLWAPLTYFDLWVVRLLGFLPELAACAVCGEVLDGERAFFHPLVEGLMCGQDKRLACSEMFPESRAAAARILRAPVESFASEVWPKQRASDLRQFLVQRIEGHIEKRLITAVMLAKL
jgi:DNA repair protein RecO (recombination protein O)